MNAVHFRIMFNHFVLMTATTKTIRIVRFPHQDLNPGLIDYEGILLNPEM